LGQLPLKVLDSKGDVITENVFAANVAVWNTGNAEIPKGAVREPFRIVLSGNVTPLDLSAISYSSPYQGFHIEPNGSVSWEHFDEGHGFRARIVYANSTLEKVILQGSANDVRKVNDLQERQERINISKKLLWIPLGVIVLIMIYSAIRIPIIRRQGMAPRIMILWTINIGLISISIFLASYAIFKMYYIGLPAPSF
jgi:hypothetical protein